jgi:hypothetical protein
MQRFRGIQWVITPAFLTFMFLLASSCVSSDTMKAYNSAVDRLEYATYRISQLEAEIIRLQNIIDALQAGEELPEESQDIGLSYSEDIFAPFRPEDDTTNPSEFEIEQRESILESMND